MSLLSLLMFMLIRLGVFNIFQIINSLVIEMLEKEIVHIYTCKLPRRDSIMLEKRNVISRLVQQ